jgi:hypothetical protein
MQGMKLTLWKVTFDLKRCPLLAWATEGVNARQAYSMPRYTLRTISFWSNLAAESWSTARPVCST